MARVEIKQCNQQDQVDETSPQTSHVSKYDKQEKKKKTNLEPAILVAALDVRLALLAHIAKRVRQHTIRIGLFDEGRSAAIENNVHALVKQVK
jgi:hypothetical protein